MKIYRIAFFLKLKLITTTASMENYNRHECNYRHIQRKDPNLCSYIIIHNIHNKYIKHGSTFIICLINCALLGKQ